MFWSNYSSGMFKNTSGILINGLFSAKKINQKNGLLIIRLKQTKSDKKYYFSERKSVNTEDMKLCSEKSGAKVFGLQMESDKVP